MAWWDPARSPRTSTRLDLRSEASLRFERGVDPEMASIAAAAFAELLSEIGGSQLHPGEIDVAGDLPEPAHDPRAHRRVNGLLGLDLATDEIAALLEPIGFDVTQPATTASRYGPDLAARLDDRDRRRRGGRPPPRHGEPAQDGARLAAHR